MNSFERELRKIFEHNDVFDNVRFVGRMCLGTLGGNNSVRVEFTENNTINQFEGIKATVLNRDSGKLDSMTLLFADVWGKQQVNNPNFKDGIIPYLWDCDGKVEWYVYKPTPADMEVIAEQMSDYLDMFRGQTQETGQSGQSML